MERTKFRVGAIIAMAALVVMCGVALEAQAAINSAVVKTRIFNDDPGSVLGPNLNNYPAQIVLQDTPTGAGFANLHNWRLSQNFLTAHQFRNSDRFILSADVTVAGAGQAEAGLSVSPWWSPDVDGRFQVRTTDGEIACFGGRLPFYSFTGAQGLTYTKGDTIHMEIEYRPRLLTAAFPATIEYRLTMGGNDYTSGKLLFDEGNPGEDPPYGLWGMLNQAQIGGFIQVFTGQSGAGNNIGATWGNIFYAPEPGSLALVGLGALALLRRRR